MRALSLLAACLASLALAASVAAQDRIETSSGQAYEGKVLSDDGTTVEFETSAGMTLKLPYENLTLTTRYRLRSARTPSDAVAQADFAEWCVEQTLYREAGRHFRAALAADAGMAAELNARVAKARTTAAKELLDRAQALQAAGREDDSRKILSTIVQELPLEDAAKQAASLLAADNAERKQAAFVRKSKPKGGAPDVPEGERAKRKSGEEFSDEARATFAAVIKAYFDMLDHTHEGLVNNSQSGAIDDFEKALKDGEKLRKETDKVAPKCEQDEELIEALALVKERYEDAVVDCRIHLADAYMLRNSYNQAAEAVNHGLAEFSENPRLAQAKERVTAAATSDDDDIAIVRRGGLGRR
jgi:hypothetical protein